MPEGFFPETPGAEPQFKVLRVRILDFEAGGIQRYSPAGSGGGLRHLRLFQDRLQRSGYSVSTNLRIAGRDLRTFSVSTQ